MSKKYYPEVKLDENLNIIDSARNFTNWMYGEIKPFLKGNILEVGSGLGTYSRKIITDFPDSEIILSEIDDNYIDSLKQFENYKVSAIKLDVSRSQDFNKIKISIDSVLALNVLEHVQDDVQAIKNVYKQLNPGGRFIILIPAHKFLFNCIDESVGHYRRYNKKDIFRKISQTEFKIKTLFYFNSPSIFGWYLNGNIFKKTILNKNALGFFDRLVPLFAFVEKYILRKRVGLSVILVLEKPPII